MKKLISKLPIDRFINKETAGGVLLLASAIVAIIWANSGAAHLYTQLWATKFSIGIGEASISKPILLWINDGLMAVFFFVVGLEIKRELLVGELSDARRAALPVAAALGGMIVPALFYVAFNAGGPGAAGWGIPMATDIAFSLGVLALLGSRVHPALRIFLTALAIADDLGAVLVIAIFYTAEVKLEYLFASLGIIAALALFAKMGVRDLRIFLHAGLIAWFFMLKSGVHATIAGVLLAFVIPVATRVDTDGFVASMRKYIQKFADSGEPGTHIIRNPERQEALHHMRETADKIETPLEKIEHALLPFVSYVVMPIFALANAGVALGASEGVFSDPIFPGIVAGLVLGKPVGIFLFTVVAVSLGVATLPEGMSYKHVFGAGLLAGIGFTMSLFIAGLAFPDAAMLDTAKTGILMASVLAGVGGFVLLRWIGRD